MKSPILNFLRLRASGWLGRSFVAAAMIFVANPAPAHSEVRNAVPAGQDADSPTAPLAVPLFARPDAPLAAAELNLGAAALQEILAHGGNVTARIGGAAGVAGGVRQCVDAVQEFRSGDTVGGTFDAVRGTGNSLAGAMVVIGHASGAATLGAAVSIVDGGKDVVFGFKDGNTERKVVGSIKVVAGTAMLSGQPVLVIVGGVTYAGVLIYEHRETIAAGASQSANWAQTTFDSAWHRSAVVAKDVAASATECRDAMWNRGAGLTHDAAQQLEATRKSVWSFSSEECRKAADACDGWGKRWANWKWR